MAVAALFLLAALLVGCVPNPAETHGADGTGRPPRLVVLLAVDQMVPDQLERLAPHLQGGLGRLVREGLVFRNATLDYVRTETGAGHTTLSSGCLPRTHGVVGNSFYDRIEARSRYCVEDLDAVALTVNGPVEKTGQRSPKNIRVRTLGEHLQAMYPGAKVASVSGKDRAAIGMGGDSRGPILWWDKLGSGFQTSTYYADELPEFVVEWNRDWQSRADGWEWTSTIPERPSTYGTQADERPGERPFGEQGVTFPYLLTATDNPKHLAGLVYQTPLVDRFTVEMGLAAVRALDLGTDDEPDLLALSFSGCDVVGHANGPYSHEVTDLLLRLDRELGVLFAELDERVGPGRWIAGLSADHGVLPLPEHLASRGVGSRRVLKAEVGEFRSDLRWALKERLGHDIKVDRANGGLTLDRKEVAKAGIDLDEARAKLLEVVLELAPTVDWIESVHGYDEIAALDASAATGTDALLRNSFHADRLPDVTVLQRPSLLIGGENGTSHGTHHWYDRHIPLVLYGSGIEAGERSDAVGSQDVVPTILARLGLALPQPLDGRDLLAE